jgi:hypothetical protein
MAPFARAKGADVQPELLKEILQKSCLGAEIPQLLPGIPDFTYSKVGYNHRVAGESSNCFYVPVLLVCFMQLSKFPTSMKLVLTRFMDVWTSTST